MVSFQSAQESEDENELVEEAFKDIVKHMI